MTQLPHWANEAKEKRTRSSGFCEKRAQFVSAWLVCQHIFGAWNMAHDQADAACKGPGGHKAQEVAQGPRSCKELVTTCLSGSVVAVSCTQTVWCSAPMKCRPSCSRASWAASLSSSCNAVAPEGPNQAGFLYGPLFAMPFFSNHPAPYA